MKNILRFIRYDFVSQVFLVNLLIGGAYVFFALPHLSIISKLLLSIAFIFCSLSVAQLYIFKATVRYELILFVPLIIFLLVIGFGIANKYNELGSIEALMNYEALERIIDFAVFTSMCYGVFMSILGFSIITAVHEDFTIAADNIKVVTGGRPDLIHYRMLNRHETILKFNNFKFCRAGLIFNGTVISYNQLYNYMTEQKIPFKALEADDFLIMHMLKI